MTITITAGADLHLNGHRPYLSHDGPLNSKTGFQKVKSFGKRLVRNISSLGVSGLYNSITGSDLLPRTNVNELDQYTAALPGKMPVAAFNVMLGDIFNLSVNDPNRGDVIPDEAFHSFGRFLTILSPTLLLPGNSDVVDPRSLNEVKAEFTRISSWDCMGDLAGSKPYVDDVGNFYFKIEECMIIGLNSVRAGEHAVLGLDEELENNRNKEFLSTALRKAGGKSSAIVFTHHNPFQVLPFYFQFIGQGTPQQTWLVEELKNYSSSSKKKSAIVCGHSHQWVYESDLSGLTKVCVNPFSIKNNNFGVSITIDNNDITIEKLKLV